MDEQAHLLEQVAWLACAEELVEGQHAARHWLARRRRGWRRGWMWRRMWSGRRG
jgi:hypothetical protein